LERIVDQASELIEDLAPGLQRDLKVRPACTVLRLTPAPTADYSFQLYIYTDGDLEIATKLVEGRDFETFWYWPLETADFTSREEQLQAFLHGLHSIISSPTRVSRRSGLLWHRFHCEAYESSSWSPMGPIIHALNWAFRAPPGLLFQSPPLTPNSRSATTTRTDPQQSIT
jgi:hypothetical protein